MFELVCYYDGGFEEEVIGVFDSFEEAEEKVKEEGWLSNIIDWQEEGVFVRVKGGEEIYL